MAEHKLLDKYGGRDISGQWPGKLVGLYGCYILKRLQSFSVSEQHPTAKQTLNGNMS
jgi:hypothetical protein